MTCLLGRGLVFLFFFFRVSCLLFFLFRRADSRSHLNPLAPWAACRISLSSIAFRFHFRFLLSSNIILRFFLDGCHQRSSPPAELERRPAPHRADGRRQLRPARASDARRRTCSRAAAPRQSRAANRTWRPNLGEWRALIANPEGRETTYQTRETSCDIPIPLTRHLSQLLTHPK